MTQELYAIGNGGIKKSTDGITFTSISTLNENVQRFIATSTNIFLKIDQYYKLYRSTDNTQTWNIISFTSTRMSNVFDIQYNENGNYFLASGNGIICKSTDAVNWTEILLPVEDQVRNVIMMKWNGSKWLAILYYNKSYYSKTSTDGETWSSSILVATETVDLVVNSTYRRNIDYFKNKWVFYGEKDAQDKTIIYYSENETNWSSNIIVSTTDFRYIISNNSTLLIQDFKKILSSSDLINFVTEDYSQISAYGSIGGISFFNDNFYLFATNGNYQSIIYKSSTGTNFTANSSSLMGFSYYLATKQMQIVPSSPPTSLVAVPNENNNTISVSFNQTGTVTNYKYSLNNGLTYSTLSPPQTASPILLSSPLVDRRIPYQIRLIAVNSAGDSVPSEMVSTEIPCLLKGMKIKMYNDCDRKVEDIKEGDLIDLFGRPIPIKKVFSTTVIGTSKNIPYVIPKDLFEKGMPNEDVYLSYNHAFFYNGWKLPIHTDILKQDKNFLGKEFTYYHFQLPNYFEDKLVCHNLPVDSYENELL